MTDHLAVEVKFTDLTDAGEFTGFASVFGETDAYGDVVERGAFARSLAEHRKAGRMPPLLWMHDPTAPVGKLLDVQETAQGLQIRGKLALATTKGAEAYAMLKEAVIDGLSIGFRTIKSARTKAGRLLQEISLVEISLVALPALASARVTTVKAQPRREPAHPMKDPIHVFGLVRAGRCAGRSRPSRHSIAARAYPDRRNQGC